MAARVEGDDRIVATADRDGDRGYAETKPSLKTTELVAFIVVVAAVLIASAIDDTLDGRGAWTLVTALTIGYMLSRGIAKSGVRDPYDAGGGDRDA